MRQKFKEGVAASGAPFFAYFLWQDKESESPPAGGETGDEPPRQASSPQAPNSELNTRSILRGAPSSELDAWRSGLGEWSS
ncbi:hypothetical protein KDL01_41920, partial [Actinospica durhamensis]|nr:hypothetical protein [Actinospica durhamensis]